MALTTVLTEDTEDYSRFQNDSVIVVSSVVNRLRAVIAYRSSSCT